MIIVGLHVGHDAAMALIENGKMVGTTSIERLSRRKKDAVIEKHHLEQFLSNWGLTIEDVDHFTFSSWTSGLCSFMQIYSPYEQRYPLSTFGTWKAESNILNHLEDSERPEKTEWGYTLPDMIHRLCKPFSSEDIETQIHFDLNIRIDGLDKTFR